MNLNAVAAQVRALCPIFVNNVAGAAGYANGVADQVWLPLPAAYVVPLDQDAEENVSQVGLDQIVHERFGIIVVLETLRIDGFVDTADRRGQAAAGYLDTVKFALFKAVLNWRPDFPPADATRMSRGIYFIGAGFPEGTAFDRARFFYQFTFGLDTLITDADGWQQPSDPLVEVQGTITIGDGIQVSVSPSGSFVADAGTGDFVFDTDSEHLVTPDIPIS